MACRILYAEDEPVTRALLTYKLKQQEGFDISWTATVLETLQGLKDSSSSTYPFDCLVLDLGLKDSFGVDTLRKISTYYNIPCIVVTGLDDADTAKECLELGAKAVFCKNDKNFDIDDLCDKIVEISMANRPLDAAKVKKRFALLKTGVDVKTAKILAGGYFTGLGSVLLAFAVGADAYHQWLVTKGFLLASFVPPEWEMAIFFGATGAFAIGKTGTQIKNQKS